MKKNLSDTDFDNPTIIKKADESESLGKSIAVLAVQLIGGLIICVLISGAAAIIAERFLR